jgi:hypothetical protein
MKTTVHLNEFRDTFQFIRPDNFSYDGLEILFNYLTELENDTGEDMELDVIALCCNFTEDSLSNIVDSYSIDLEGEDDHEQAVKDYLEDKTILVGITEEGNFIYQNF